MYASVERYGGRTGPSPAVAAALGYQSAVALTTVVELGYGRLGGGRTATALLWATPEMSLALDRAARVRPFVAVAAGYARVDRDGDDGGVHGNALAWHAGLGFETGRATIWSFVLRTQRMALGDAAVSGAWFGVGVRWLVGGAS